MDKSALVIGNGFDVALGRKTRYSDFYDSKYCPKKFPAPLIAELNKWTSEKDKKN